MKPETHQNIYQNAVTGATPNPVMPNPDAIDEEFAEAANRILSNAVELIRVLIGAAVSLTTCKKFWRVGFELLCHHQTHKRGSSCALGRRGSASATLVTYLYNTVFFFSINLAGVFINSGFKMIPLRNRQ